MLLAWSDDRLKRRCSSLATLRAISGEHADATEDLVHAVANARTLGVLLMLRSIRIGVRAGGLKLSLEETDMYARLLTPTGEPHNLASQTTLPDHAAATALIVDDLTIAGRSALSVES